MLLYHCCCCYCCCGCCSFPLLPNFKNNAFVENMQKPPHKYNYHWYSCFSRNIFFKIQLYLMITTYSILHLVHMREYVCKCLCVYVSAHTWSNRNTLKGLEHIKVLDDWSKKQNQKVQVIMGHYYGLPVEVLAAKADNLNLIDLQDPQGKERTDPSKTVLWPPRARCDTYTT